MRLRRLGPFFRKTAAAPERRNQLSDDADQLAEEALELLKQGHYGDAEARYERALAIREEALGHDHLDLTPILSNLASVYQGQGRQEAEEFYKRALAIRENALGPDHPDVAQSLRKLAWLYQAQGRRTEAEPLLRRASRVGDVAHNPARTLPGSGPSAGGISAGPSLRYEPPQGTYQLAEATSFNRQAVALYRQARYAEAELPCKRALAIREQMLGPHHLDVAQSLDTLAGLYHAQGRYIEAEPLFTRALTIYQKAVGHDHPGSRESEQPGLALPGPGPLY